jgi:hypothetical protein
MDLGDGPARIGCESCGERNGCVCDRLLMCNHCGRDFLPPFEGDHDSGLCKRCVDKFSDDDDVVDCYGEVPDDSEV